MFVSVDMREIKFEIIKIKKIIQFTIFLIVLTSERSAAQVCTQIKQL